MASSNNRYDNLGWVFLKNDGSLATKLGGLHTLYNSYRTMKHSKKDLNISGAGSDNTSIDSLANERSLLGANFAEVI